MNAQPKTFTELINAEIAKINIEKLASESNVVEVGAKIALLSSFLPRIGQEVASRQSGYNLCLNEHLTRLEGKSVVGAKVAAEASVEHAELLKAKALREAIIEYLRGLKYLARALAEEESFAKHV